MPRKAVTLPLPERFYPHPQQFERLMTMLGTHAMQHNQHPPGLLDVMDHYIEERLTEWFQGWRGSVTDRFHHALCYHSGNVFSDAYAALSNNRRGKVYPDLVLILTEALRCVLVFADQALIHTVARTICGIYNVLGKAQEQREDIALILPFLSPLARVASSVALAVEQEEPTPFQSYAALLAEGLDRCAVAVQDLNAIRARQTPPSEPSVEEVTTPELIEQVDGSMAPSIQAELDALMAIKPLDAELELTQAVLQGTRRGEDAYLDAIYKYLAVSKGYLGTPLPTTPELYWYARQLLHYLFNSAQWAKLVEALDETLIAEQAVTVAQSFLKGTSLPFTRHGLIQALLMVPVSVGCTQEMEKEYAEIILKNAYLDEVVPVLQASLVCHRVTLSKIRSRAAVSKEVPKH